MSATPAQLRAVAAALTPHSHQVKEPWYQISPLCDTLDYQQRFMVQQAYIFGNMALWRAVALTLELAALRLEQEQKPPLSAYRGVKYDEAIVALVRAYWAKDVVG